MTKRYYCKGSVRGHCGHTHRTINGALTCLNRDKDGCHKQGGYSDRRIYDSEGNLVELVTDDKGRAYAVEE